MKSAGAASALESAPERGNASALAVERAAEILLLLAQTDAGSLSITELARETKASGSAIHRILTALRRKQLVDQHPDTQRYALSWRMLTLFRQMNSRADLRGLVYPYMIRLRDLTTETITLNVRSGFERVCVEAVEGPHEVRWVAQIGRLAPLHSGVTGELLLAYADESDLRLYWRRLTQLRRADPSIPSRTDLGGRLKVIAAQGYALARSSHVQGIDAVSAPILGAGGHIAAALTIAGPAERCTLERLESWLPDLKAAADEISQLLEPVGAGDTRRPSGG
jgi:DNA-binding IclR family transcriptional regulator